MKIWSKYFNAFGSAVKQKSVLIMLIFASMLLLNNINAQSTKHAGYKVVATKANISTFVSSDNLCAGSGFNINFITSGKFKANNFFIAQLSNAFGSFETPVELGKINGIMGSQFFVTIPTNIISGTGYRIRVISTIPSLTSCDNKFNIAIKDIPEAKISVQRPTNFSLSNPVILTATAGEIYTWSNGAQSKSIIVSQPGTYSVKVANVAGCGTVSSSLVIAADPITVETQVKPSCSKSNNGVITIAAKGGYGAYEYSIDGGATYSFENVFVNLKNGTYPVVVKSNEIVSKPNEVIVTKEINDYDETKKNIAFKHTMNVSNKSNKSLVIDKPLIAISSPIKAYPNPASQYFSLTLNNVKSGKAQVQLTNPEGYVVFSQWVNIITNNQTFPINLKSPLSGVFVVKVLSGNEIHTSKVMLKG